MTKTKAQSHWDGSTIPSQVGKVAIITGGNSGIGYATALQLVVHGARVILACRNEDRARHAVQSLQSYLTDHCSDSKECGTVEFMLVGLSSLESVRAFADTFCQSYDRLDLLINNAGIVKPQEPITVDGFITQFGVNHLAHFYLTALLFHLLRASPSARVVNVSSLSHRHATFNHETVLNNNSNDWTRYGHSKLANLYFTYELQRRLTSAKITNVCAVAAHPGVTYTEGMDKVIVQTLPTILHRPALWIVKWVPFQTPTMGALPILYAATAEGIQGGEYIGPRAYGYWGYPLREKSSGQSLDEEKAKELWELSEKVTKISFDVV